MLVHGKRSKNRILPNIYHTVTVDFQLYWKTIWFLSLLKREARLPQSNYGNCEFVSNYGLKLEIFTKIEVWTIRVIN